MDVDLDTSARSRSKIIKKLQDTFGKDNILNICTYRTETSKSACKTACRGLEMTSDEGDYIASLIIIDRGKQWSISDCFNGNKEKDRKSITEFINEVEKLSKQYNVDLKHTIEMIEGLVSGLSLHASGIYIFKDGYIKQNGKMKTPRGDEVTAWEMSDSDYAGGLKYDSLTTECQDKLEVCLLDLLSTYNKIEPQKTIRDTYNKYLHPDVLDYDNKEMWDKCSNGQIIDLFQFVTPVGGACIKKIQPKNLNEMSNANSLMRISIKNGEQPIDKFLRYKQNLNLWYEELKQYKVENQNEIKALEKILLPNYGVSVTQEDIMELSMEKEISNFSLADADGMRKIVAKKKDEDVENLKNKFYDSVASNNNSLNVANYVWEQCIVPQLAYSFSRCHVLPYSCEALQEMNLYHYYPTCYWNCSALSVNAGIDEENDGTTNYGKIAKAIYRSMNFGVPVLPPDINKSGISFTPIEENNTILFGLGGINGVNQEIAKEIINGRPYTSFKQFYDYHKELQVKQDDVIRKSLLTKSKIIKLIQSGCFDCFNTNRITTMKWFIYYETLQKESLTIANLPKAIEYGVSFNESLIKMYNFKQYVINKNNFYCKDPNFKSKKHYIVEPKFALPYLEQHYLFDMKEEDDYYYESNNLIIIDKSLEKVMKKELEQLKEQLNDKTIIDEYNKKMLQENYISAIKDENVNRWAFQASSFYHNGKHELDEVDLYNYNISCFSYLNEIPIFEEKSYKNRVWKQYDLTCICGTVLDRQDNNHLVNILTSDNKVITINMAQAQFGYYKQTISKVIDGKKVVIDDSWLKRGKIIIVSGYRRDDNFFAKKYKNSFTKHLVSLVTKINKDKTLEIQYERNISE